MRLAGFLLMLNIAATLFPGDARSEKVLHYSDHEPLGGMRTRFVKDVFFSVIERESGGRLRVGDHWDSSVAVSYDALRVTDEGKATDMAIVVPEYTASELPLQQVFERRPQRR